ncbi:MAG: TonB-dependent siderophore receptor [Gammaproteobacteria bacterium]|nr:MAG: TonB-dependent siderophore receptor [Gammaproteobacteria bacterium]
MRQLKPWMTSILLSSALMGPAAIVQAQAVTAAEDSGRGSGTIDEMIVTGAAQPLRTTRGVGSRLGLTTFETPASVHLIDREQIDIRGDHSTSEAMARAPGFAPVGMQAFAGSALSARGFSGNASIGQLYDGNRLLVSGGAMSFPIDTWGFQRVEVLSGPASVLHGSGTVGGAVNYVPRSIERSNFAHEAMVALGSWDTRRVGLATTGPLADNAAFRLNGVFNDTSGYVERNDNERWAVSVGVEFDVTANLTAWLLHDSAKISDQAYFGTPLIDGRIDPRTRRLNYNVEDAGTTFRNDWSRVRLRWQPSESIESSHEFYYLDTARNFRNLEFYTHNPDTGLIDRRFNFATDIDQTQKGTRHDVRFDLGLLDQSASLLIGFEYNEVDYGTATFSAGGTSVDPFDFEPGVFDSGAGVTPALATDTRQYALFAETALDVTDTFKLLGGLRVEQIDIDRVDRRSGLEVDLDFSPVTWRVGALRVLGDNTSIYGQYVVGNDAGGSLISLPAVGAENLQTGRQMEIGIKQALLDDRIQWTAALYRITRNNLLSRDPANPELAQQIGKQSSQGLEISVDLSITQRLHVDLNAALIRAKFDDFNERIGTEIISRKGNRPVNVPERTANLYAHYALSHAWRVGGGARYAGRRFSDTANARRIPSYVLADAFVAFSWREGAELTARVRNLFDERWVVQPYNSGFQWALGDPRSYELALRLSF